MFERGRSISSLCMNRGLPYSKTVKNECASNSLIFCQCFGKYFCNYEEGQCFLMKSTPTAHIDKENTAGRFILDHGKVCKGLPLLYPNDN